MRMSFVWRDDFFCQIDIIMLFLVDQSSEAKTIWMVMRLELLNQLNFVSSHTEIYSPKIRCKPERIVFIYSERWRVDVARFPYTLPAIATIYSSVGTRAHQQLGALTTKPVSRNLIINLRLPGTVGLSQRPNFVRHFRAISDKL